jgi:hypothetical protein
LGDASTVSFGHDGMKQVSGNQNVSIVDEYNPIIVKCGKQIKSPLKNDVMKIIPGKEP